MKKIVAILLCLTLAFGIGGCTARKNEKPLILCTLFAHYDFARAILGEEIDRFELKLLGNGADLHSYEASAMDLATIGQCDLLIYNGGESEQWVDEAVTETKVNNVLKITEEISLLTLPHQHSAEEHQHEFDEHTWLSLNSAAQTAILIGRAIAKLDPQHKAIHLENTASYTKQLLALDEQYSAMIEKAARKSLVLADRYPFRYLAADYGLDFYAAFDGCSAETEAGAATVAGLARLTDQLHLPYVLILENSKEDLANTVIESTRTKDQQILRLDSMQAMTAERIEKETYLSIMEKNLDVLKIALN